MTFSNENPSVTILYVSVKWKDNDFSKTSQENWWCCSSQYLDHTAVCGAWKLLDLKVFLTNNTAGHPLPLHPPPENHPSVDTASPAGPAGKQFKLATSEIHFHLPLEHPHRQWNHHLLLSYLTTFYQPETVESIPGNTDTHQQKSKSSGWS